jgi:hypothetical protein
LGIQAEAAYRPDIIEYGICFQMPHQDRSTYRAHHEFLKQQVDITSERRRGGTRDWSGRSFDENQDAKHRREGYHLRRAGSFTIPADK